MGCFWTNLAYATQDCAPNKYLVVGGSGLIFASNDGKAWVEKDSKTALVLTGVCAGPDGWVAVGEAGVVTSSVTGDIWEAGTTGAGTQLRGIVFAFEKYIAVGNGGAIYTAATRTGTWTARASGTVQTLRRIFATATEVVVVGDGGIILRSADGTTWLQPSTSFTGNVHILYDTDRAQWVAVDSDGNIGTSPTGAIWTARSAAAPAIFNDVANFNGVYVAVGANGAIQISADGGVTWAARSSGVTDALQIVMANTAQVITMYGVGRLVYSTDANTWHVIEPGIYNAAQFTDDYANVSMVTPSGLMVEFGFDISAGVEAQSFANCLHFQEPAYWGLTAVAAPYEAPPVGIFSFGTEIALPHPTYVNWEYLTYTNGRYIQSRSDVAAAYLIDSIDGGNTWNTQLIDGTTANIGRITLYDGTKYVTATNGAGLTGVKVSSDFTAWSNGGALSGVGFGYTMILHGAKLVVVGNTGSAFSTDHGTSWSSASMPANRDWYSAASNGSIIVALAWNTNKAAYSTDGAVSWTEVTLPATGHWIAVCWNGAAFIAVADAGSTCLISSDGIAWTAQAIPSGNYYGIAANSAGGVCAVGTTCVTSTDNGATWTAQTLPGGFTAQYYGVASDGTNFCVLSTASTVIVSSGSL